jgi:hypothetical protein
VSSGGGAAAERADAAGGVSLDEARRLLETAAAARALSVAEALRADTGDEAARAVLPDLIPGGQLLDTDYPPVEFAIDPVLPLRELTEWVGRHGIFKSTLALAAGLAIATGRRFGGLPVRKGKAVFITAEDSERTIALRVRAWLESIPVGEERRAATAAVRENFYFLAREHVRGLALTLVEDGEPAARAGVVARLTELVEGAVVVFLETAARLAEGDENANRVQAAFAQVLEQIAIDSGAAVGIVRHVGKAAAREGATDSYAGRGGGALSDAARSVVNFTRPDAKGEEPNPLAPVVMTHAKATLSRPARTIQWQPVETVAGVYLRALSDDEEVRANARKLLAAFPPDGVTATDMYKKRPAGLSRTAGKAALDLLVETKLVVAVEVPSRGTNRQPTTVYQLAEREA